MTPCLEFIVANFHTLTLVNSVASCKNYLKREHVMCMIKK